MKNMKRTLSLMLALCLVLSLLSGLSLTAGASLGGKLDTLRWKLDEEGVLTVYGNGPIRDFNYITRPAPWYEYKDQIRAIVVEEGVTAIGENAFQLLKYVTSASIADSVTQIGDCAFYYAGSLQELRLGNAVTIIGSDAFSHCDLRELTIPGSVKTIDSGAFENCSMLTSLRLESGVKHIKRRAFSDCWALKRIELSDTLSTIGENAFQGVRAPYITFPATLSSVASSAFWGSSLAHAHFLGDMPQMGEEALGGTDWGLTVCYLEGTTGWDDCVYDHEIWDYTVNDGCSDSYACNGCDYTWGDYIPHVPKERLASDPTCTEPGCTDGIFCAQCNAAIEGQVIPALGHDWLEGEIVSEPTELEEGGRAATCLRCGTEGILPIPVLPCPSAAFGDVKLTAWYHDAADWSVTTGFISGIDGRFAATTKANRAMLVTILHRMAGEPVVDFENPFTDVKETNYFFEAVLWAAKNGIVNGTSDTTFAPKNLLTREQAATILYRYTQSLGIETTGEADLSIFPDGDKIGSYAKDAMNWAVANKLINGNKISGVDYLDAKGTANRGQLAIILMNFDALIHNG